MGLLSFTLFVASLGSATPLVVVEGAPSAHVSGYLAKPGGVPVGRALSGRDAIRRMTGRGHSDDPNEKQLASQLARASDLEAEFETRKANAIRDGVVAKFEDAFRPSAALRRLAARALHGKAAILLTERRRQEALTALNEAARRFPEIGVEDRSHGSELPGLLAQAKAKLNASRLRVSVETDGAGELWVDGRSFGTVRKRSSIELTPGTYRFWIVRQGKSSLPVGAKIDRSGKTITLTPELDRRLHLGPTLLLRCTDNCGHYVGALRERLNVPKLLAVRAGPVESSLDILEADRGRSQPRVHIWEPVQPRPAWPTLAIFVPRPTKEMHAKPPQAKAEEQAWAGYVIADFLSWKLLGHVSPKAPSSRRHPTVYTWLHTAEVARSLGFAALAPTNDGDVKRTMKELGAYYGFTATYSIEGDHIAMHWRVHKDDGPLDGRLRFSAASLGEGLTQLTEVLGAAIGGHVNELVGHETGSFPQEALRSYGEGLRVLGRQRLTPHAKFELKPAETKRAEAAFLRATDAAPTLTGAWMGSALLAALDGRQQEAEKRAIHILTHGNDFQPLAALGLHIVYARGAQRDAANETLAQYLESHPGFMHGFELLGNGYLRANEVKKATEAFGRVVAASPRSRRGTALLRDAKKR